MEKSLLCLHKSPKRKRDDAEGRQTSASTSLAASQPAMSAHLITIADDAGAGRNSPQVGVTGQLQELDLHGNAIHLDSKLEDGTHSGSDDDNSPNTTAVVHDEAPTTEAPTTKAPTTEAGDSSKMGSETHGETTLLISKTQPQKSPDNKDIESDLHSTSNVQTQDQTPSPRGSRSKRKSPPLNTEPDENPLTWHESEITGYDPTDPNDDGEGLDGIGFKPTAAIAWDRDQRRKKQITEWKNREAREARARRRERRDGIDPERDKAAPIETHKRVKFED